MSSSKLISFDFEPDSKIPTSVSIIDFLNSLKIPWFPIPLKIKKKEGGKYEKLVDFKKSTSLYGEIPKQTDFELKASSIEKRQKYVNNCDYIAFDTRKYYNIDVDFLEDKMESYNERTLAFAQMCKKCYPFFKSTTKKNGFHSFFITETPFTTKKRIPTKHEDIEILCGQWSWVKKDTKVFNSHLIDEMLVTNKIILQIIKEEEEVKPKKEKKEVITQSIKYNDTNFQEVADMAELINLKYLDDYTDWCKIIWGLKNTDESLINTAKRISQKSNKYDEKSFLKTWSNGKSHINAGSIFYYAKLSNINEYNNIRLRYIDDKDDSFISADDTLAGLFLKGNDGDFILKDKMLYTYHKNRWYEDKEKSKLGYKISKDLNIIFNQKIANIYKQKKEIREQITKVIQEDNKDAEKQLKEKEEQLEKNISFFKKLICDILSSRKTDSITKKVIQHLSVRDFENIEFDNNPYLFCFKNKIYDLKTHNFITTSREDYILTYLSYDYQEVEKKDIKKLNDILKQIFPDEPIRDNYIHYLATGLYGETVEKFIIANGDGGNGKSLLNELVVEMLEEGIYAYTASNSVLLQPIKNGSNPEIANMNKKRFIVFREPEAEKAKLNLSIIKELTGGSRINARLNYSNNTKTDINGTFIMECNNRPKMDGKLDEAVGRRLSDIPFKSTFTSKKELLENENLTNVFRANKELKSKKFQETFKLVLFHYLINYIKEYEEKEKRSVIGTFEDCEEVKNRTSKYIEKCDEKFEWFSSNYVKDNNTPFIQVKDIYTDFKESDLWGNMTKRERRETTLNDFKEYLQTNINFRMFYKERYKYKDESGKRKEVRSVLLNFRQKEEEEKEQFFSDEE